jgi:hypothetical protein
VSPRLERALNNLLTIIFLHHPEHLDKARLTFFRKTQLMRSYALGEKPNSIWELILKINELRNVIAHRLEKEERVSKIEQLRKMYMSELDKNGLSGLMIEGFTDDEVVLAACGTCLNFLATFEQDVKALRKVGCCG